MANLYASLASTCKGRISKISTTCQILGGPCCNFWSWPQIWTQTFFQSWGSIPQHLILNWEMQYLIWTFFSFAIYSLCIFLICILYLHKMHKYKLFLPALLPRIRLNYSKKLMPLQTQQSCKQKWHPTIVITTMHCNVTPDVRSGGPFCNFWSLPQKWTQKIFPILEAPVHNFWSWTEKFKIYLDIFYGISCNIKCITAISHLHFHTKYSKLTFSNGTQLPGKKLWQICMHHWPVHAKVEFQKFPPHVRSWEVHAATFDHDLRYELKHFFQSWGSIPQHLILNWEMQYLIWTFFSFAIYSLCIFLICILYLHKMHKYKLFLPALLPRIRLNYSKKLMPLQTEMTSHNSHNHNALQCNTRCQIWGSILQLLILTPEMNSKNFSNHGGSIPQLLILNWEI